MPPHFGKYKPPKILALLSPLLPQFLMSSVRHNEDTLELRPFLSWGPLRDQGLCRLILNLKLESLNVCPDLTIFVIHF